MTKIFSIWIKHAIMEITKHVRFDTKCIQEDRKISFEVGGELFTTYESTLQQFPNTLLGDEEKLSLFYDKKRDMYVLNRDKSVFALILSFYQSGGRSQSLKLGIKLTPIFNTKSDLCFKQKNFQILVCTAL